MQNEVITVVSVFFCIASLMIVSVINRRQTRKQLTDAMFQQLKRRASEIVDLEIMVEPLLESTRVAKQLNQEVLRIIDKMRQLSPENPFIDIGQSNANQRQETLNSDEYQHITYRYMESDSAIARAQQALNASALIIRRQHAEGYLEKAQMEMYVRELSWAHMMVLVITHIGQGHKMADRDDRVRALAYYKKALEHVTQPGHSDPRQNQYITEIGELLNNKRTALTEELMPEIDLNPKKT